MKKIKHYFGLFIILGIVITSGCKKDNKSPLPSITTTSDVVDITAKNATNGGTISNDGGNLITARGVCWKTSPNPTINDSKSSDGTGAGLFSSYITGLAPNTTYYVRAYATNSTGTAYGSQINFTTKATMLDGVWTATSGTNTIDITISGSSGTFSKIVTSSNTLGRSAFDNGFISLGSQDLKNITYSSTNRWTCTELYFYSANSISVTAVFWSTSGTITMTSDENSIDVWSTATYNGVTYSGTSTMARKLSNKSSLTNVVLLKSNIGLQKGNNCQSLIGIFN